MHWNKLKSEHILFLEDILPGELAALSLRFSAAPKRSRKGLLAVGGGL
jgi:hypothetical protein